jgi:ABC-type antimicrobial peptide transport system permease subunit
VIIIDESLAKLAWPGRSAVGRQLQIAPTGSPDMYAEVVGVVEHQRIHDLARPTLPQIYGPIGIGTPGTMSVAVEASVPPASLATQVRRTVASLDKDLPVDRLTPMETYVGEGLAQARFSLILMAALGGIALVLAAVGIFGVISYSVSQRTREFGIRLALGEDPESTRRSVILGGMRLIALSIGLGLVASFGLTRVLAGLLYEVGPGDPVTFAGITVVLAVVALVACYLPARRATRVDPMTALRSE